MSERRKANASFAGFVLGNIALKKNGSSRQTVFYILDQISTLKDDLSFVDEQLRGHSDPFDTVRVMWQQRHDQLMRELERFIDDPH